MREVRKINDKGEVIAIYSSVSEAERDNGIAPQTLHGHIKLESPCKGFYYECDAYQPCYWKWDSKKKKRGGMYPCPFEDVLRYFVKVLPYKYRRKCKTYIRKMMLHKDMQPYEAFLRYYLKYIPFDVYVGSDEIIELIDQWRNSQTNKSPMPTDSLKSDSSRSTDGA